MINDVLSRSNNVNTTLNLSQMAVGDRDVSIYDGGLFFFWFIKSK